MFEHLSTVLDPTDPFFQKFLKGKIEVKVRTESLGDFPLLRGLVQRVAEEPGIKKWMETRPKNEEEPY